jgi:hypothetical protein
VSSVTTIQQLIDAGGVIKGRRTSEEAVKFLPDFAAELGLPRPLPSIIEPLALSFIVEVILPISWYTRKISNANKQRMFYLGCTAGLIILIPVGLAFLPKITGSTDSPPIIAQLSGVLTAVLTLQKTLSACLASQQRFGAWWKISSDLKKIWYGFQTKWMKVDLSTMQTDFVKDLQATIEQARTLVSDEEYDFFQKLTLPTVDILDLLSKSRSDTTSMIGALLPGAASANAVATAAAGQATDSIKAMQDLAKYKALWTSLDTEITKKTAELAVAPPEQKATRIDELNALMKRRSDVRIVMLEAQAAVTAFAA